MTTVNIVLGLLALLAVLCVVDAIKSYKKKRLVYSLKRSVNSLQFLIATLVVLYFFVITTMFLPDFVAWFGGRNVSSTSMLANWLMAQVPFVYVICQLLVVIKIFLWCRYPMIKYTEQEKMWIKESDLKFREKLPRFLKPLIKVGNAKIIR